MFMIVTGLCDWLSSLWCIIGHLVIGPPPVVYDGDYWPVCLVEQSVIYNRPPCHRPQPVVYDDDWPVCLVEQSVIYNRPPCHRPQPVVYDSDCPV